MIGEPEIDGGWETASGAEGAAEALPGGPEHERENGGERVRGARRPWLWALGGVVAASAVWAGTLAVQDRFPDVPRLDYRHSPDLCKEFELGTVGQVAGREFQGRESAEGVSLAQDWSYCTVSTEYQEGTMMYGAQLLVELHKKGDPETEFATGPGTDPATRMNTDERFGVTGLGDRAMFDRYYAGGGSRLMVLDGGSVFTLTVQWYNLKDGQSGSIDESAMDAAMIEDMRALMTKLER
ncbi:hypothetical protein [Streptomyces sp. AP-93]|uniref:hypothetical protein n=1 Tax=Streptomyces sp. AP-93 TaxID=2929048 RepID=UPI001FB01E39|nr:hypothetical protein [Streptomyces sp. AP-93]MCJ0871228.1 hypothetical protein [Streptomyces sp. AP-93]